MAAPRGAALLAGMALLWAGPATAATILLTFDDIEAAPGRLIRNTEPIPQSYGDRPGLIDVAYGAVQGLGSAVRRQPDELRYWDRQYSDLTGVAYCCGLGLQGAAEILLRPLGGNIVELQSVDFGDYLDRNNGSRMLVFAADDLSTPLFDSGPFDPGTTALTFANLDIASDVGLRIQWAQAYTVGIDNVTFTVTPLPGAAWLLLTGLGVLALWRRRAG